MKLLLLVAICCAVASAELDVRHGKGGHGKGGHVKAKAHVKVHHAKPVVKTAVKVKAPSVKVGVKLPAPAVKVGVKLPAPAVKVGVKLPAVKIGVKPAAPKTGIKIGAHHGKHYGGKHGIKVKYGGKKGGKKGGKHGIKVKFGGKKGGKKGGKHGIKVKFGGKYYGGKYYGGKYYGGKYYGGIHFGGNHHGAVHPNIGKVSVKQQFGCNYVSFTNRAFKKFDLRVNASIRTPADCLQWFKNNANLYQAVEYNFQSSICSAVKKAEWNNTVASKTSDLYVMKPNLNATAASLQWFTTFVVHYDAPKKIPVKHQLIKIQKIVKLQIQKIPASLKKHVHEVIVAIHAKKLTLEQAAKQYYAAAQKADKKLTLTFDAWWKTVKAHFVKVYNAIKKHLKKDKKQWKIKIGHKHKHHNKLSKEIKKLIKKLPASIRVHIHKIIAAIRDKKLTLEQAAKQYYEIAKKTDKKLTLTFEAWWKIVKVDAEKLYNAIKAYLKVTVVKPKPVVKPVVIVKPAQPVKPVVIVNKKEPVIVRPQPNVVNKVPQVVVKPQQPVVVVKPAQPVVKPVVIDNKKQPVIVKVQPNKPKVVVKQPVAKPQPKKKESFWKKVKNFLG